MIVAQGRLHDHGADLYMYRYFLHLTCWWQDSVFHDHTRQVTEVECIPHDSVRVKYWWDS